jgi:hypothetical protein
MAPLSGMARHRLASRWQRLLDLVARRGQRFYNFEGLRRYKAKFGPYWRPRYLAAPGGLALPGILLDVTRLIGGGVRTASSRGDGTAPQPPELGSGVRRLAANLNPAKRVLHGERIHGG